MQMEEPPEKGSRARRIIEGLERLSKDTIQDSIDKTDNLTPFDDVGVRYTWNKFKIRNINVGSAMLILLFLSLLVAFIVLLAFFIRDTIIGRQTGEVFADLMTFVLGALTSSFFPLYTTKLCGVR